LTFLAPGLTVLVVTISPDGPFFLHVGPQSLDDDLAHLALLTFELNQKRRWQASIGELGPYPTIHSVVVATSPQFNVSALTLKKLRYKPLELPPVDLVDRGALPSPCRPSERVGPINAFTTGASNVPHRHLIES
jgi:hypothetical protein